MHYSFNLYKLIFFYLNFRHPFSTFVLSTSSILLMSVSMLSMTPAYSTCQSQVDDASGRLAGARRRRSLLRRFVRGNR